MQTGQPGDKRKFQREHKETGVTKDIPADDHAKWPKCQICGMDITGKKYRVAEGKYVCFLCNNE